jgi:hypothetical protein
VNLYRDWIQTWKKTKAGDPVSPLNEKEQTLIEKKKIEIEREKLKLGIETRQFVSRDEVNERITTDYAIVRRELYKAFEHDLPPRVEGMSAMEIRKSNRKRLDEILRAMPRLFSNGNGSAIS